VFADRGATISTRVQGARKEPEVQQSLRMILPTLYMLMILPILYTRQVVVFLQ
jgi:hypothetical protein